MSFESGLHSKWPGLREPHWFGTHKTGRATPQPINGGGNCGGELSASQRGIRRGSRIVCLS
ncbi:hypothetical protein [Thalassoglobus sp.]|uniref:hypothetical protein n=1 Tax=Thalassoglobus sp. TaxID=2795869 RepID=UPI003AA86350